MSDHEKLLLKTVPIYMALFVGATLALEAVADGMSIYVMVAIAGGSVSIAAVAIEVAHTGRTIATRREDFQQTVRDLDDQMSGRGSS